MVDWELTERAESQLSEFDPERRDRIVAKLDDVGSNEWRDPPAFLEPVRGLPHDDLPMRARPLAFRDVRTSVASADSETVGLRARTK